MVWTDLVAGATGRLVHGSHQGMFERQAWSAHAEKNAEFVNTLTRSGEAKGRRKTNVRATRLGYPYMITLRSGYNPARCSPQQIVAFGPRYSAEGHHIFHITARPLAFIGD
jgi:hypothetical protein